MDRRGADSAPLLLGFPKFVGHRRRLPPDDELFDEVTQRREEAGRDASCAAARDEACHLTSEAAFEDPALAAYLSHEHECATCHAAFPTSHLLSIHLSEVHDSFFAAQAARRMPVYVCLVEACSRKFCTIQERKQHVVDHHRFPKDYNFDRMHVRRRKGQVRPLPEYQKVGGSWNSRAGAAGMATESSVGIPGPAMPSSGAAAGAAMSASPHDEDLASGFSRLSMAAERSEVPSAVSFGRRAPGLEMPRANRARNNDESAKKRAHVAAAGGDAMKPE